MEINNLYVIRCNKLRLYYDKESIEVETQLLCFNKLGIIPQLLTINHYYQILTLS